jgi:hypothetical protein
MPCAYPLGRQKVAISANIWSVKFWATLIIPIVLGGPAAAGNVPMPRPRPAEATMPQSPQATAPNNEETASECQKRLRAIAAFTALPPVTGPGECAAEDVVQLDTILLPGKAQVAVTPPAMLRCNLAEAIAKWVREEVAPRVRVLKGSLRSLDNYASYDCRGRNNVPGAILSEHGKANALDIRSLVLTNGTVVKLTDPDVSKELRDGLRKSACARFATVLGPGSDGYHEDHIHVDLAERSNGQHLCRWDVREPEQENTSRENHVPLPRPRPVHGS